VVAEGELAGNVAITIGSLIGSLDACGDEDTLDGGAGNDLLAGDQAASVSALVDARTGAAAAPNTWTLTVQIGEVVGWLHLGAEEDLLTGGSGDDTLTGDSQMSVSAFRGAFGTPLAGTTQLTGTELVDDLDIDSDRDTLRGGDGNDNLAGDSETTVAVQSGGMVSGLVSALARLIDRLGVTSSSDDIKGDAGTNTVENGNRAVAPSSLVKSASISSKGSGTPVAPVINWNGRLDADVPASSANGWMESFVNGLGREEDPNARIKIKL